MLKNLLRTFYIFVICAGAIQAAEIKLAISLALPPYVIAEENRGMELDIVRQALAKKGHTITIDHYPAKRVLAMMESGRNDAAIPVNESSGLTNVYYSDSHIAYQNVAIALKENAYSVPDIAALANYSVLAFQNATKYLGSDFLAMSSANKKYKEKSRQDVQITAVFKKGGYDSIGYQYF